jgi:PAS domain S-box-containing protein
MKRQSDAQPSLTVPRPNALGSTDAESWLASIIESSDDGIIGKSLEGIVTSWNLGAKRIFGYSAAEAIGKPITFLIPRELWQEEVEILTRLRNGERISHYETTRIRKDQTRITVSLTVSPVLDSSGTIRGFSKIARDVTETKRIQDSLTRQSRLLDLAYEAILVHDLSGQILYWNRGAERIYGWPAREALGKINHLLLNTTFSEPLETIQKVLIFQGYWEGELCHTTREGKKVVLLSRWVLESSETVPYILETNFDLTEYKQYAEREQFARAEMLAERRFRELIEHAPDGILQVDHSGTIIVANYAAEKMFGYSRDELMGEKVDILVPIASRPGHEGQRKAFASAGVTRSMGQGLELKALRKDGSEFAVEISLSPVHTGNGTNVTAVIRDVTERKQAEQQIRSLQESYTTELECRHKEAERLNQLKSEFMASVSHELRTPLHTIIGFAELLNEEADGPLNEKQKRFLHYIQTDSEHLLGLINDVLDLSRIEAGGGFDMHPETLSLQMAVSEGTNAIRPFANEKSISIREIEVPEVQIVADPLRFRQILYNLLSNAMKFTEAGGEVSINAVLDGIFVQITISDTGIGISPEESVRIFDKFYQVGQTTAGVRQGTGLGLTICKQLVELQGGKIWVDSEPGVGSHFHFTVPAHRAVTGITEGNLTEA